MFDFLQLSLVVSGPSLLLNLYFLFIANDAFFKQAKNKQIFSVLIKSWQQPSSKDEGDKISANINIKW